MLHDPQNLQAKELFVHKLARIARELSVDKTKPAFEQLQHLASSKEEGGHAGFFMTNTTMWQYTDRLVSAPKGVHLLKRPIKQRNNSQ